MDTDTGPEDGWLNRHRHNQITDYCFISWQFQSLVSIYSTLCLSWVTIYSIFSLKHGINFIFLLEYFWWLYFLWIEFFIWWFLFSCWIVPSFLWSLLSVQATIERYDSKWPVPWGNNGHEHSLYFIWCWAYGVLPSHLVLMTLSCCQY